MTELLLMGTGGPAGWPLPWCPCASCARVAAIGPARAPTAVVVDGTLLLDCGRGSGHDPAMAPGRPEMQPAPGHPLTFIAPPSPGAAGALVHAPARRLTVQAGDRLDLDGYEIRVLDSGHPDTVLYDLTGPDGGRVLYGPPEPVPRFEPGTAPPTPALPGTTLEAMRQARYDVALLDVVGAPGRLAPLRDLGALAPSTDVIAVHLTHTSPGGPELARRLASWGARAVPDGTYVTTGRTRSGAPGPAAGRPRRTLVLGGARSGKSAEAERCLAAEAEVTYVATGTVRHDDPDWAARVALHRARRPVHWATVETTDLVPLLAESRHALLIDCLSLWLTAVMDETEAWDDATWENGGARQAVAGRVAELAAAWRTCRTLVVAVSNEVGCGVVPHTSAGRRFRDELGRLNTAIATESEQVLLVVAGQVLPLR